MESQEPQDVEMRIVIYSLLSAEGSLQSQMVSFLRYFYSPLEGATKLKFLPFCSSLDVLLHGIVFFMPKSKISASG